LRVDAVPKILGVTQFTIDLSLPVMLTALMQHPPRLGAMAASVADAQRGLSALTVEWDETTPSGGAPPSCWPSICGCSVAKLGRFAMPQARRRHRQLMS
jgi:hypothetical protein